jgi:hypothetical protein
VVGGKIEIENGGKNHDQVKQNDEAKMFPEKFGLDKRDDQPKRTFDFIQHEESVYVLQRCLEIWRKRV